MPMTDKQRAALEAGRQRRSANLRNARAAKAVETLEQVRSEASSSRPKLARDGAPLLGKPTRKANTARTGRAASEPTAISTSSGSGSSATRPPSASDGASDGSAPDTPGSQHGLAISFEAPEADRSQDDPSAIAFLNDVFGIGSDEAKASGPKPGAAPETGDKFEAEVAAAAETWREPATSFLVGLTAWMIGTALAPSRELAQQMMMPLLRILMRHSPGARSASPDVRDLTAAGTAATIYAASLREALAERRRERQAQSAAILAAGRPVGPNVVRFPAVARQPGGAPEPAAAANGTTGSNGHTPGAGGAGNALDAIAAPATGVPPNDVTGILSETIGYQL